VSERYTTKICYEIYNEQPGDALHLRAIFEGLFDFQASAFRQALFQFGQGEFQNTVHILGLDLVGIHAGDVKASGVGAVGTLHTDHFILLVLFLHLGFALSPDDQSVILNVQSDILLLKAGQVSFQQVVVALVRHISAELCKGREC